MKLLQLIFAFLLLAAIMTEGAVLADPVNKELEHLNFKIKVLRKVLAAECPMIREYHRQKRQTFRTDKQTQLEADKIVYFKMYSDLIRCNKTIDTTSLIPEASVVDTEPSHIREMVDDADPSNPSKLPQPSECGAAINFTDPSRLDNNGSNYKPGGPHSYQGYACDLTNGTQWFRFSGAAGNRMLNTCPKYRSCGALYPLWSDGRMPESVGVQTTIEAHRASEGDCKYQAYLVHVMRCSEDTDHDLIYKLANPVSIPGYRCHAAFCGMM